MSCLRKKITFYEKSNRNFFIKTIFKSLPKNLVALLNLFYKDSTTSDNVLNLNKQ